MKSLIPRSTPGMLSRGSQRPAKNTTGKKSTVPTAPALLPLGASAVIPGGTARVNGIIPLEKDGWLPPERVQVLDEGPSAGTHRVRILVQFTALEGDGVALDTSQFSVTGLGANSIHPLWTSPGKKQLKPGDTADATMVFELPNQAIALVLEGPGNTRLSLGLSHHTS